MNVYIRGAAQTKFGKLLDKSISDLLHEASVAALKDAHLDVSKIDYVVVTSMIAESVTNQGSLGTLVNDILGLNVPAIRVEGACASGGVGIATAYDIVKARRAKNVLVVGVEKMTSLPAPVVSSYLMHAADKERDYDCGLTFPGIFGLVARSYLEKYGVHQKRFSYPSIKRHKLAFDNPHAHFQKLITHDQIDASRMVADPLKMFHCAPISDGAAALVLSADSEMAQAEIVGSSIATDTLSLTKRKHLDQFKATQIATQKALQEARITINDITLFEVHDGFSIVEIITMEDLGLCKKGEGAHFIFEGNTLPDGKFPVNVSGGLKAGGHPVGATGVRQLVTITKLLQSGKYEVALAQNVGGSGSVVSIHAVKKV